MKCNICGLFFCDPAGSSLFHVTNWRLTYVKHALSSCFHCIYSQNVTNQKSDSFVEATLNKMHFKKIKTIILAVSFISSGKLVFVPLNNGQRNPFLYFGQ